MRRSAVSGRKSAARKLVQLPPQVNAAFDSGPIRQHFVGGVREPTLRPWRHDFAPQRQRLVHDRPLGRGQGRRRRRRVLAARGSSPGSRKAVTLLKSNTASEARNSRITSAACTRTPNAKRIVGSPVQYATNRSHATPSANVINVTGTPTRQ